MAAAISAADLLPLKESGAISIRMSLTTTLDDNTDGGSFTQNDLPRTVQGVEHSLLPDSVLWTSGDIGLSILYRDIHQP